MEEEIKCFLPGRYSSMPTCGKERVKAYLPPNPSPKQLQKVCVFCPHHSSPAEMNSRWKATFLLRLLECTATWQVQMPSGAVWAAASTTRTGLGGRADLNVSSRLIALATEVCSIWAIFAGGFLGLAKVNPRRLQTMGDRKSCTALRRRSRTQTGFSFRVSKWRILQTTCYQSVNPLPMVTSSEEDTWMTRLIPMLPAHRVPRKSHSMIILLKPTPLIGNGEKQFRHETFI